MPLLSCQILCQLLVNMGPKGGGNAANRQVDERFLTPSLLQWRTPGIRFTVGCSRNAFPVESLGSVAPNSLRRDAQLQGYRHRCRKSQRRPRHRYGQQPQSDFHHHPLPPRHRHKRETGGVRRWAASEGIFAEA